MPPAPTPTTGPQPATFSYLHFPPSPFHPHEKPYEILINLPLLSSPSPPQQQQQQQQPPSSTNPYRRSNQQFEEKNVMVHDVRGREGEFSLDGEGVCWRKWGWEGWDAGGERVRGAGREGIEGYLRGVEGFIKRELERGEGGGKVDLVKVFDYKLRLSSAEADFAKRKVDLEDGLDPMIPATHPHVDQSFDGAIQRVHHHMKEEAAELLRRRFRIINVWKPLKPIKSWPLAVCDSGTVRQSDLITSDLVRRRFVGETFYAKFNPDHRWYYLSEQQPDEVTMLKIYDSDKRVGARFCLHSAFQFPGVGSEEVRESFEVRALVFDATDD